MTKSPYMQTTAPLKVFIPTYQRAQSITTHKLFLNENIWELKIVVHTEAEKKEYIKRNPELKNKMLVSNAVGIAGQRAFIDEQVRNGEWYISGDDDIEHIMGVKGDMYNLPLIPEEQATKENYNHVYDEMDIRRVMIEMIIECERTKLRLFGFNSINNPYFRMQKFRRNAFIIGVLWGTKKTDEWSIDTLIKLKEDYERTAKHFLYHGGTLRNDYVSFKTKMYADGGVGSLKDRTPDYVACSTILIEKYPQLFEKNISRDNPDAEIRIIPRTEKQVIVWRLKMIIKRLLPLKYIYVILKPAEAEKFITKYKL